MSHFTKIKTKLYDRTILERSLLDLNIQWESGTKKLQGFNNQEHEAELVIRDNNKDIGFYWNGQEYELITDLMFWKKDYSVNKFLNQITQRYAFNYITEKSTEKQFQFMESQTEQDGSVRLLLRKFT